VDLWCRASQRDFAGNTGGHRPAALSDGLLQVLDGVSQHFVGPGVGVDFRCRGIIPLVLSHGFLEPLNQVDEGDAENATDLA